MQASFAIDITPFVLSDSKFYLVIASTKDVADLAAHYSLWGKTGGVVVEAAYSKEDFQSLIVFEMD